VRIQNSAAGLVLAAVLTTSGVVFATSSAKTAPEVIQSPGLASFDEVWQTIADTFYDPSFGGLDWNEVRAELRPRVEATSSPDDARRVINEMLARLKRSHFVVLSSSVLDGGAPIGEATVPIEVRVAAQGLLITNVEAGSTAGLVAGQWMRSIDGRSTADWKSVDAGPDARLRTYQVWRRAYRALHGDAGSLAELDVEGIDGRVRHISARRIREAGQIVALGNLPPLAVRTDVRELKTPEGRRVGFIAFNLWMTAIAEPVAAAVDRFRSADGIVLDLRGNPGGLAAMMSGISGHFMSDPGTLLGRMQTRQGQLEFRPNPRLSTSDGRRVVPFAGPVAILVDELTASASECFTGALQSLGRARVFGRQTMGEALPALTMQLPNGDVLIHAIGDFVTATGRSMEGGGVTPDEPITLTPAALAEGRNPDLAAALSWLDRARK
jgi:carboxyl-terminal processing protease